MPAKTSSKKKTKSRVQVTKLKKSRVKPWHVVAALALFIAGGFVVAYSRAAQPLEKQTTTSVSIAYYDNVPVIQVKNGDQVGFTKAPHSIEIDSSGQIYCMPSEGDEGTSRQLAANELAQLRAVANSALNKPANTPPEEATVSARTLFVAQAGQPNPTAIAYSKTSATPANFDKAINALEQACASSGTQRLQRIKKPKLKETNPASANDMISTTPLSHVLNPIGKAYALSGPLTNYAFDLIGLINQQRVRYGLPALQTEGCLNQGAEKISGWNATLNIMVHTTNMANNIGDYCKPNWTKLGENISRNPRQDIRETMFYVCLPTGCAVPADPNTIDYRTISQEGRSYMASPSHRSNILNNEWHRIGAGAYVGDNGYLYTSSWFMVCKLDSNKNPMCGTPGK